MSACLADQVLGMRAPDHGKPISSFSTGQVIGARRVLVEQQRTDAADGGITFGPEEPVYVRTVPRVLPVPEVGELSVLRLEFSARTRPDGDPRGPRVGEQIIVAGFPYSNFWIGAAPFKPGRKRGRDDFPVLKAHSLEAALAEIEAMSSDPWERGATITAGFFGRRARELSERRPRNVRDDEWVVGIASGFAELAKQLLACARAQALLERTRMPGQRVFRPAGHSGRVSSLVHPAAADEAPLLLAAAVHQALAGPRSNSDPGPSDQESESSSVHKDWCWTGRPVMDLVERIYFNHLYNQSRVHERKAQTEQPLLSESRLIYQLPF